MADKIGYDGTIDVSGNPIPKSLSDRGDGTYGEQTTINTGTAITGESLEAGGAGLLGWLASLRKAITDRLPAALTAGGGVKVGLVDALSAGEAHLGAVGGEEVMVSDELTRPANTTAYTAGDVVSNSTEATTLLTFANAARVAGRGGYIVKARLDTDKSTWASQMRLWLFNIVNPANIPADNAPFTRLYAHRLQYVGYIDFVACATEQAGSDAAGSQDIAIRLKFQCAAADRNIYGLLQDRTGGTPNSGQKFTIALNIEQN